LPCTLTPAVPAVLLFVPTVSEELLRDADGCRNGYADGCPGNDLLAGRHTFVLVLVLVVHLGLHFLVFRFSSRFGLH